MPIGVDFHFSKVVIIESLEPHEVKTGKETAGFVGALDSVNALGVVVEYHFCEHANAFAELVQSLIRDASITGSIPLLHVECHGDQDGGLEFQNGSVMSWADLSTLLVSLNRATGFNLVAVFSACYGAYFLTRLSTIDPAPCYAMIAPTEAVANYEILAGTRNFYSSLFSKMDAGAAVDVMMRMELQNGQWFGHQAELWYERVVNGYVETYCTKAETKVRALRMLGKYRLAGKSANIGDVKRSLIQANRSNLTGKFFERYFMTDAVQENFLRFSAVRIRIEQRITQLRITGRYSI